MNFASDNIVGASAPVLDALVPRQCGRDAGLRRRRHHGARRGHASRDFRARRRRVPRRPRARPPTRLARRGRPALGLGVCHREAHVIDDECGAPEFFMHGAKLIGLPGVGGKIAAADVAAFLDGLPKAVKQMPPKALSISQATECGTVYSLDEIARSRRVVPRHGLVAPHGRGALRQRARRARLHAGRDDLEAGRRHPLLRRHQERLPGGGGHRGLRSGAGGGAGLPRASAPARSSRRAASSPPSSRAISRTTTGSPMPATPTRWRRASRKGSRSLPGVRLAWPTEANEVFPILPQRARQGPAGAGAVYHPWTSSSLAAGERVGADEG